MGIQAGGENGEKEFVPACRAGPECTQFTARPVHMVVTAGFTWVFMTVRSPARCSE